VKGQALTPEEHEVDLLVEGDAAAAAALVGARSANMDWM
jgi:hypothetical protein